MVSEQVESDIENPQYDESDSEFHYYTIALLGKSGQGKSSTANKLLQINDERSGYSCEHLIKEWRCPDSSLLKVCNDGEPKAFKAGGGAKSVTRECQLLSNEQTRIRVLDIPGFADSQGNNKTTVQRNAGLIDSVVQIQLYLNIRFHRILYFLPIRGVLERSDAYTQDELKTLYYYFGDSVFKCMVIIATKRKDTSPFDSDDENEMNKTILYTMREVTKKENPFCPRVVFLPSNATFEQVLHIVQSTPVESDQILNPAEMFWPYCGDDNWDEWVEHFESVADQRALDNNAKLQMMNSLLTGDAKGALDNILGQSEEIEYNSAKSELEKHIYSARYKARKKKVTEEWKSYTDDLCALAKNAFPGMREDEMNQMIAKDIRLQAMYSGHLSLPNDLSLDSVVIYLTATEAIPDVYTAEDMGKEWKNWITNFDSITSQRSLSECTRVQWLEACLAGKALEVYHGLPQEKVANYNMTKETFSKMLYTYLFDSRQKLPNERWDSYANELQILAKNGFPNLSTEQQEKKILECILCQVADPSLKTRHWKTLDEALIFITATNEIDDVYDDETGKSWEAWLVDFETKCDGISNKQKLQWLKVCINQKFLPSFETLCKQMGDDYFGVTNSFPAVLQFQSRYKLPDEEWEEVYSDLALLATKFVSEKERDDFVLNKLLLIALQNGVDIKLYHQPNKLSHVDAISIISAAEAVKKIEKYSGNVTWEKWIKGFESALFQKGKLLHNNVKVRFLQGHLIETALEKYRSLTSDVQSDYDKVKQALEMQFNMQKLDSARNSAPDNIHNIPHEYSDDTGETWETWLKDVESMCKTDITQRLQWIEARISKKLMPLFKTVCIEMKGDYPSIIKEFPKQLFKKRFESRTKLDGEDWEELCHDLCLLVAKFVPGEEDRSKLVLRQLLFITEKSKVKWTKIPATFEEALGLIRIMNRNVKKYSGEGRWEVWLSNFESALGAIPEHVKVILLESHLELQALYLFQSLTPDVKINYISAKQAFEIQLYSHRFQFRKKSNESWEQFANDLNSIAEKAFPDKQKDNERSRKVLEHFMADPMMKDDIKKLKPESIKVAMNIIAAMEVIRDKYSRQDGVGWEQWIAGFEQQATQYQITKTSKVLFVCLAGKPRQIFDNKVNTNTCSYEAAIDIMQRELHVLQREHYKSLFEARVRNVNESISHFVGELRFLAAKAYLETGSDGNEADKIVLIKLMKLMQKPKCGLELPSIWLDTLDGAILTFNVLESMKYKQFSDGEDWDEWIYYFENTVSKYETPESNDYAKLQCFEACISGIVKTYYQGSKYYRSSDYRNAEKDVTRQIYMKMFQSRAKEKESWRQLSNGLYKLALKAYPDCTDAERDKKVLSRFLNVASKPELTKQNPESTDWAVTLLEYWEMQANGVKLNIRACTKCCLSSTHGEHVVEDEDGKCITYLGSKCHAQMIDKYTTSEKILGGTAHVLTFGLGLLYEKATSNKVWQGFTNAEKFCCSCKNGYGTPGCLQVKKEYEIIAQKSGRVYKTVVDHTFKTC